jgi:hypothetical protein
LLLHLLLLLLLYVTVVTAAVAAADHTANPAWPTYLFVHVLC